MNEAATKFADTLCEENPIPHKDGRPIVVFARDNAESPEFNVTAHGVTLFGKYSQVWDAAVYGTLLAKIALHAKDLDGKFGPALLNLFVGGDGRFSVDGTTKPFWLFVAEHGEINREARAATATAIVETIQKSLEVVNR
jgi:hypothetical protein